jgi:hypothetical protein
MSGKIRHLLNRDGRYFARLVVPKDLRPYVDNRAELRTPLGADRRYAIIRLPGEVAKLQHRIAVAEREAAKVTGRKIELGRYPLPVDQIALTDYLWRLSADEKARAHPAYALVGIDDRLVRALRGGMAGTLTDNELNELVGERIERYRHLGNTSAEYCTEEWRTLARALCIAEYEALSRTAERDEADFTGIPAHPMLKEAKPVAGDAAPTSIRYLFDRHIRELKMNGAGEAAERRWRPVIDDLITFAKTDDANKVTRKVLQD